MTRRALGLTLGSVALAQGQGGSTVKYAGALDGFESKVDESEFDPVVWSRKRWESSPLRMRFQAAGRAQAEGWQKKLRAKIAELIGPLPDRTGVPKAQLLESREFPGYTREKIVFESRPGVGVLAYLLRPKTDGPLPAMICVPGHGRGVDDIVGIDEHGQDRTDKAGYQHDFAIQAVEHGMAAMAIEPMAFGCRRDPAAKKQGLGHSSCQPAAGAALLFGETMIGWRVFDVMRAIDWIESRKDLDASRVGLMGISGGGTCTLYAAALDRRIKTAFMSCSLCSFRDCILSISHCIDNYVPGILNWAEMYDVAGLIAPRPFFAESGDRDDIFPLEPSRDAFARVKKIYDVFGAPDQAGYEVFSGEHSFHGVGGLRFAAEKLGAAGAQKS
jgi:dienelactone hydrolase